MPQSLLYPYFCFSDIQLQQDFMKEYELSRRQYFHRSFCLLMFWSLCSKKQVFYVTWTSYCIFVTCNNGVINKLLISDTVKPITDIKNKII